MVYLSVVITTFLQYEPTRKDVVLPSDNIDKSYSTSAHNLSTRVIESVTQPHLKRCLSPEADPSTIALGSQPQRTSLGKCGVASFLYSEYLYQDRLRRLSLQSKFHPSIPSLIFVYL